MGFEISLEKPPGRDSDDNRVWAEAFRASFPEFAEIVVSDENRRLLAQDLASDISMTPDEYVARNIGLQLDFEHDGSWVSVEFWEHHATITLPNFPTGTVEAVLAEVRPHLEFLVRLGFSVVDPATTVAIESMDWGARLTEAYLERQRQVERVACVTGGKPM